MNISAGTQKATPSQEKRRSDFWKYWTGQTISQFGNAITLFAFPLIVFKITHSAINLSLTTAAEFVPYLLFGLFIGAWTDRSNRKRLMIWTDILRCIVIATVPIFSILGILPFWWIYVVGFIHSTLSIFFEAGQFAAIPSLVNTDDLVTANGRIQASYSTAQVAGPLLAGVLVTFLPVDRLVFFDALSFLISALAIASIRTSFNASQPEKAPASNIGQETLEGLRYVLNHPILRNISMMMAMINFVNAVTGAQLVFFTKERFGASDAMVSLFYGMGSLGIVVLSLLAGPLRKRWSFSTVALGALMLDGLLVAVMAFTSWYWVAALLWATASGLGILFNINTGSLRQKIVPNHMLGRIMSIASVLAWSAIPLGSLLGGFAIAWTQNIVLVYAVAGGLVFCIAFFFRFTTLGHAERYLPVSKEEPVVAATSVDAVND